MKTSVKKLLFGVLFFSFTQELSYAVDGISIEDGAETNEIPTIIMLSQETRIRQKFVDTIPESIKEVHEQWKCIKTAYAALNPQRRFPVTATYQRINKKIELIHALNDRLNNYNDTFKDKENNLAEYLETFSINVGKNFSVSNLNNFCKCLSIIDKEISEISSLLKLDLGKDMTNLISTDSNTSEQCRKFEKKVSELKIKLDELMKIIPSELLHKMKNFAKKSYYFIRHELGLQIFGILVLGYALNFVNQVIATTQSTGLIEGSPRTSEATIFSKEESAFNQRAIGCIKNELPIPGGGVLFYGEPGNGKTLTVKHIAEESGAALMTIKPSDLCKPSMGQINTSGATALKAAFNTAYYYNKTMRKPIIIFVDEVDFAGQKRMTVSAFDMKCIIAELLQQVQVASKIPGIYLMAATNYNEYLDKALKRDGRFGQHVFLKNPDFETVSKMIGSITKVEESSQIVLAATQKALGFAKSSIIDSLNEAATDCLLKGLIEKKSKLRFAPTGLLQKLFSYFKGTQEKDSESLIDIAVQQNASAFWDHLFKSFDRKAKALQEALDEQSKVSTAEIASTSNL